MFHIFSYPIKYTLALSLLFIIALLPTSSYADIRQSIIDKAIEETLWEKSGWLHLLHYDKEYNNYVSQVDDDRFFYAPDGRTNPEAELLGTLKHLFLETSDNNKQTQCKFVSRTEWLLEKLEINKNLLPVVHCDKYLAWQQLTQADSVTMIFPAYHLNSPSSMFGHTLLRLDSPDKTRTDWLSFAVNFGANINDGDNSLVYAYRGLAGGYPGSFIIEPYFKKIQEYNRIEHRDIWEYKLNLTPEETRKLIAHLWELKTMNFDYYFFDENCSYRLLELIEVARPSVELTDEFIITAIPVDTVRAIEEAKLIESIDYIPARATEIQYALEKMPKEHREVILRLSEDFLFSESDIFTQLTVQEQKSVIDIAYKYLRYNKTKEAKDPASAKRSFQLLQKLNSYPVDVKIKQTLPTPIPPEKGHKSKRVTIGLGQRLNNDYAEIGFKMSFHDLEDNKEGFLQGAQINIGSLQVRAEENIGLRLYKLDFVDIFSLTPKNAFFDPLSWRVYTGFERQLTKQKDQLTYHLTGGAGGTWQIIKNHQYYALLLGRLEINKQLRNTFEPAIGFTTGFLSHFKHTTARLEVSGEQFEDDVYRLRAQYTQNIVFSTNHSIKLFAKHEWHEDGVDFSDINLSYQYYF